MDFYELNKIINERLSGKKYVGRPEREESAAMGMGRKKRKPGNRPGGPRSASLAAIDRSHLKYSRKNQFDYQADVNEDHSEMSEDDYKITPSGHLGGKVSVSANDKFLGEFSEVEDALGFIRKDMENNNWSPNIWWVADHGNHWMIDLEGKEIKENADDMHVRKQMSAKQFSKRKKLTPEQLVTQATDRWAQEKRVAQAQAVKKENIMDFHELNKKMNDSEYQYNEADDHERYYQTSQAYRRAYDKARAGNSPADIEREHQSDRDAMIRSSKDLRDLVKEMHSALDEIGFDAAFSRSHTTKPGNILKDIAHSIQYIADELRRMGMGDKRITSAASSRNKDR